MIEVRTKLRKWGNSLGIVVPLESARKENIEEGQEVVVLINKRDKVDLRKLFGTHKFSKPVSQLMRETDDELEFD